MHCGFYNGGFHGYSNNYGYSNSNSKGKIGNNTSTQIIAKNISNKNDIWIEMQEMPRPNNEKGKKQNCKNKFKK